MNRRAFLGSCAAGLVAAAGWGEAIGSAQAAPAAPSAKRKSPYILGADVSWLLEDEAAGATYWDRGVQKDLLAILVSYGFNSVRGRLFVNPSAPGGYSRRGSFCDLPKTLELARRVKGAGMSFLLDFHYADTWTSPGKQSKPAAWAGHGLEQLVEDVGGWTTKALGALKAQGTTPAYVQIGNETTTGMLYPEGREGAAFARLVGAGVAACRAVDPAIQVAVHNHLGRDNTAIRAWVDNFLNNGVTFDIIGMSCYSEAKEGNWKANFDDIAVRYPQVSFMALEYSYKKRYLNDLIHGAPNGKGLGSYSWEPTRWREAIFDKDGVNAGDDDNNKPHLPASTLEPSVPDVAVAGPAATYPTTGPTSRRWRNRGGRYQTNQHILEYPAMAAAYV